MAITYILTLIGKSSDVASMLITTFDRSVPKDWSNCLDRRQVWNQKRPPWFEALHHTIYPILTPIVNILVSSMQTGATIYQVCVCLFSNISHAIYSFDLKMQYFWDGWKADNGFGRIVFDRNTRLLAE